MRKRIMDDQTDKFPGYIANCNNNLSLIDLRPNKNEITLDFFAFRIGDANVHKIQNESCMEHILLHEMITYNIILLAPKTLNINNFELSNMSSSSSIFPIKNYTFS